MSRTPPRCSLGTIAIAGRCRGAQRKANAPILIASGYPKSCCNRPRCGRSRLTTRVFLRAGRMYARSRNLHACARAVAERHGGAFPADEAELRALPGIGDYTAAAIAAIAFDIPASPVDGNIERVVARLFAVEEPLPAAKPRLRQLARTLTPQQRPGDFAQAMMDLRAAMRRPFRAGCRNATALYAVALHSWCGAPTVMCWCDRDRRRVCWVA